jgi:LuxR family transcriptional regulator, maltose regulon positive regulatory protein
MPAASEAGPLLGPTASATYDGCMVGTPEHQHDDDADAGWAALSRGAWEEARSRFESSVDSGGTPGSLEGLSWANWWLEDAAACMGARERAFHRHRDAADARGAARMALWLGDDHLEFHGEHAVADGWFARSARILEGLEPCPEHGWLTVFEAYAALQRHDLAEARRRSERARASGHRHGAVDLEMFSLAIEGVTRVEQGDVAGLRCLDEAATAALNGEYENLVPAAWTCCLVMSTCERVRDFARAEQWCRRIEMFGRRMDARFLRGQCRAHHGTIQSWRGSWEAAGRELVEALDDLTTRRPSWRSEGLVRLGHFRRRQGRCAEAQALFEQAAAHPLALLGQAALSLDRHDPATARDLLERTLRRIPPGSRVARVDALELLVRVEVAMDELEPAAVWLEELRSIADEVGTDALRAAVHLGEGLLAAAFGDHRRACACFEDAIDRFVSCEAPVETARARLYLCTSLLESDRPDAASHEVRRALADLGGIDAEPERAWADALSERVAQITTAEQLRVLTDRQVEVLRLIARGMSDRQIADRLVLSRHTVHRHVANIYTRLGCSSRPAAVAEASRMGLL